MDIIRIMLVMLGFAAAPIANATFTCTGTVTYLGMDPGGGITLANGFGVWYLCSVSSPYNSVPTETCKSWYAGFISAQKASTRLRLYFTDSGSWGDNDSRCTGLGSWVTSNPYFVQFLES